MASESYRILSDGYRMVKGSEGSGAPQNLKKSLGSDVFWPCRVKLINVEAYIQNLKATFRAARLKVRKIIKVFGKLDGVGPVDKRPSTD